MMTNSKQEAHDELIYLVSRVKDHIHTQAYSGDPSYKWLDQAWSVLDLLESIKENNLHSKDEAIRYFLDIAHLFGKDRI